MDARGARRPHTIGGAPVVMETVSVPDVKALPDLADRSKASSRRAAIVLGATLDGRVALVVSVAPDACAPWAEGRRDRQDRRRDRRRRGGGRDTLAQAGGRDPEKLEDALAAARTAIVAALAG